MTIMKHGAIQAAKELMLSGQPITRLEAIVLFGISNFPDVISEMRKQGWVIESRKTTYAAASKRINQYATLEAPANLPVREIMLTEYWINK